MEIGSYAAHFPVFLGFVAGLLTIVTFLTDNKFDDKVGNGFLTCTWISTLLFVILLFIIAGVFAPVSIILSDVCVVLDDVPNDFDFYLGLLPAPPAVAAAGRVLQMEAPGDMTAGMVLKGCFTGVPLLDTLNITDGIDLGDVFADFDPDLSGTANFSELDSFSVKIDALTVESFGQY